MPDTAPDTFPAIPFAEAIANLRRRGLKLVESDHWRDVWQEEHQSGFTVARSAGFDILKDISDAMIKVAEEGTTFRDFTRDLVPILQKKGWWGKTTTTDPDTGEVRTVQLGSLRRLLTIFDVNLRVSHAQGRWQQQQEVKEAFPYLRYVGILDSRIRPLHRTWHGVILPIDHPWWKTHYPPNGWRCRCDVMSVSNDDLERFGWEVNRAAPNNGTVAWIDPKDGSVKDVPAGIDPGWDYNPGDTSKTAEAAKRMMNKLQDYPPMLGAEAFAHITFTFPHVEGYLGDWLYKIANKIAKGDEGKPKGEFLVVGCIDKDVLSWLVAEGHKLPETAAISITDQRAMHMQRESKDNRLSLEEMRRLPSLLRNPDAVYWDKGLDGSGGGDKREPGLVYVWDTGDRKAGKIVMHVDFKTKVRKEEGKGKRSVQTNSIRSGRVNITPERDLHESKGYIKIKGTL
jgi:SPP1 gp7 family putative phage head morphogenesis protein